MTTKKQLIVQKLYIFEGNYFFPCQRRTSPGSSSSSSSTTVTLCWTSPGSSCSMEVFAALVVLFKAALAFARPSLAALAAKIVAELRCSPGSSSSSSPEINRHN